MIKKCAHCEIDKPIESFTVHSRNKDGRHYLCKDCKSSYQKELREKYPDRYVKYRKTVNLENKRNYLFRYKHGFEREEAIKLLNDLILSLANELCKNGDDSADAATQLKNILKDLLNSLCPMNEIEKFNPVYISSKSDSYKNITSVVKSPI